MLKGQYNVSFLLFYPNHITFGQKLTELAGVKHQLLTDLACIITLMSVGL